MKMHELSYVKMSDFYYIFSGDEAKSLVYPSQLHLRKIDISSPVVFRIPSHEAVAAGGELGREFRIQGGILTGLVPPGTTLLRCAVYGTMPVVIPILGRESHSVVVPQRVARIVSSVATNI